MKFSIRNQEIIVFIFLFILVAIYVTGCGPEKKGPVAMLWHNTTARYNGLFIANKKMKKFENKLNKNYDYNYNRLLDVYPKLSDQKHKSNKGKMKKIIEDASLPIQFHKNSKWADDAYITLGKARYYMGDYENAITTFKYVNSKSESDQARHRALIWLMRTYMDSTETRKAREVANYLNQQDLSKSGDWNYAIVTQDYNNYREFSLLKGQYYMSLKRYKKAAISIGKVVHKVRDNDRRARLYYLLGQIYHKKINADDIAYKYYSQVFKNNPPYKLWFYAKLNQALVTDLKDTEKTAKDILEFYRKLLKDEKNKEFHDKIYYQMAKFEMKRDSINNAIDFYNKSLRASNKQNYIKAFSYLNLAQIYYEIKKEYRTSKKYYDSTVAIMDKSYPEYPPAKRKQETLLEFVKQLEIVQTQDSLQRLAAMDSATLRDHIDSLIVQEQKRRKKEWKKEQKRKEKQAARARRNAGGFNSFNQQQGINQNRGGKGQKWYFYDESVVARGKQAFQRKWGNRPLQDNWRLSSKVNFNNQSQQQEEKKETDSVKTEKPWKIDKEKRRKEYYDAIPLTQEEMDSSNAKLSNALFSLGQIYNQKLKEPENAIEKYKRHLREFPENKKTPKILYSIYIIYKNKLNNKKKALDYKNRLINNYPHSIYAKLAQNPDYLKENALKGEKAKKLYGKAYDLYKKENYLQARSLIDSILNKYERNPVEDKLQLLRAMITGETQNIMAYQNALRNFINNYKTSPLKERAKKMLSRSKKYVKNNLNIKGDTSKLTLFNINLNYPHFFVIALPPDKSIKPDKIASQYRQYNKEFFSMENLKVKNKKFDSSSHLIIVKEFPNKIQAMNYYETQKGKSSPISDIRDKVRVFTISAKNFPKLIETKDIEGYRLFFRNNYL